MVKEWHGPWHWAVKTLSVVCGRRGAVRDCALIKQLANYPAMQKLMMRKKLIHSVKKYRIAYESLLTLSLTLC